jgi:hypothetical protein
VTDNRVTIDIIAFTAETEVPALRQLSSSGLHRCRLNFGILGLKAFWKF